VLSQLPPSSPGPLLPLVAAVAILTQHAYYFSRQILFTL
jgi:hypothetical protein